jgi:fatty-acyl-CoA synthase
MRGLMMDMPLTLQMLMNHAEQVNPTSEVVSVTSDNPRHRYTFKDAFNRTRQLANALKKLGVEQGDFIGTLAWNDYRHFEIYFATGCGGAICHTINPKLFPEQIEYIVNHGEDKWLMVDPDFVPLLEQLEDKLPAVQGYIVLTNKDNMPTSTLSNVYCYEELITGESTEFDWPTINENDACGMCYTSGTTGNPKGVVYSHRALVLHTYAGCMPDVMNISIRDTIMPIVPMFHVNAWNWPYSAAMVGCKLVFPGSHMGNPETLQNLIEEEQVTFSAGVPTVWLGLLAYLAKTKKQITSLERVIVGGAACPLSIMEEFENKHDVYTHVGWGMTEMSPLGTLNSLPRPRESYSDEEYASARVRAGRPVCGVEMKIVDEDNNELPWDGVAFGTLKVRGPWVCAEYFKLDKSANDDDGWFDTGDVANINADGSMQITDRTKDVIKSGGEWISSIELENCAVNHPAVAEAAVIGAFHPKWSERPLLIVVKNEGMDIGKEAMLEFMTDKVAKWWLPEDVVFIDQLPHTATGKIQKVKLREHFADYKFPNT